MIKSFLGKHLFCRLKIVHYLKLCSAELWENIFFNKFSRWNFQHYVKIVRDREANPLPLNHKTFKLKISHGKHIHRLKIIPDSAVQKVKKSMPDGGIANITRRQEREAKSLTLTF
jgi:hypothetical protein